MLYSMRPPSPRRPILHSGGQHNNKSSSPTPQERRRCRPAGKRQLAGIVILRELPLSPLADAFIEIIKTRDVQAANNVLGLAGVGI